MRKMVLLLFPLLMSAVAMGDWLVNFADNPSAEADANRDGTPDGWLPMPYRSPVVAEPVNCRLVLPMPSVAMLYALDPTGKRRRPLPTRLEDGRLVVETRDARSPWLEVVAPQR